MLNARHPEFPLTDDLVYLNHAAVAPWPKRTRDAVLAFADDNTRYGSSHYPDWLKKESGLRNQLQTLLNAPSVDDIALVKNTSEAISFVAYGLDWNFGDNIVTSNEEFPSNRIPWESLYNQGVELRQADLRMHSSPEQALFALCDKNTRLLTISSVQFASGLRLDLDEIGGFCKSHGILFCIDAIQSLGALEFDVQSCQADFVMADGHKWMLGPEGLGVFFTTQESRDLLKLTQFGWHMMKDTFNYENKPWEVHPASRRFECGSPNMLGIHAYSASLSLLLETTIAAVERRVTENSLYLIENINRSNNLLLETHNVPELLSGIVSFHHKSVSSQQLFQHLISNDVLCALRGENIRFSPHFYNFSAELEHALQLSESCQG